jgi:N-formylglutamate deformylase
VNSPFAGTYVPQAHYGTDLRVASIMIEIRRDGYLADPAGVLAAALAETIDAAST